MLTITIDIIDNKAIRLLQDLELLQLIHVHKENQESGALINWASKYKGAMTKHPISEIDNQQNELRNGWE